MERHDVNCQHMMDRYRPGNMACVANMMSMVSKYIQWKMSSDGLKLIKLEASVDDRNSLIIAHAFGCSNDGIPLLFRM